MQENIDLLSCVGITRPMCTERWAIRFVYYNYIRFYRRATGWRILWNMFRIEKKKSKKIIPVTWYIKYWIIDHHVGVINTKTKTVKLVYKVTISTSPYFWKFFFIKIVLRIFLGVLRWYQWQLKKINQHDNSEFYRTIGYCTNIGYCRNTFLPNDKMSSIYFL